MFSEEHRVRRVLTFRFLSPRFSIASPLPSCLSSRRAVLLTSLCVVAQVCSFLLFLSLYIISIITSIFRITIISITIISIITIITSIFIIISLRYRGILFILGHSLRAGITCVCRRA